MISQKNVQMLDYLCSMARDKKHVRVEELAAKFRVSARTVRYDLYKIDYYLKVNGYPELEHVKGSGIFLNVPDADIEKIRHALGEIHVDIYVLSKLERALYIQMMLFTSEIPLKYEELAEELFVSRKTVIEDVRAIKDAELPGGAHIGAGKTGIFFSGGEAVIRRSIVDQILELFSPTELWELGSGILLNRSVAIEKKWSEMLANPDSAALAELMQRAEADQCLVLTDDQFYLTILLTTLAQN